MMSQSALVDVVDVCADGSGIFCVSDQYFLKESRG